MTKAIFNWKREKKKRKRKYWFNFKIFRWKSKTLLTATVLGVVEKGVSRFLSVYFLCFTELQSQIKTGELWSGGALELKCPGSEAVLKHEVWNRVPRACRTQKENWGEKCLMNPSWIHHLVMVRKDCFEWKISTSSYITLTLSHRWQGYDKETAFASEGSYSDLILFGTDYGLFYKFLYCQNYPSTYAWVVLGDCTVILKMFLLGSIAKVITETRGIHNLKRSEEDCHCMSIFLILVNVSMQKWKRIIFQRQKENLTEI